MRKAIRKAISALLVVIIIFASVPLAGFVGLDLPVLNFFSTKAKAATEGYYTYSVSNNEATITKVDTTISGDIIIPSTLGGYPVTSIGIQAFIYCKSVESITIPDSVTSIGEMAFTYCSNLKSITVDSDNTAFSSDESGILFNKNKTELILYPAGDSRRNYVIPDNVTTIGMAAFAFCKNLESVTIGNCVTSVDLAAFSGCTNLKSLTIPKSLTVIGSNVFPRCDNIKDVYYEGSKADWNNFNIGSSNGTLLTAKVHYNYRYNDGSTEVPDNTPDYDSSLVDTYLVPTPTETTISYGDSIVLHIDPAKIPEGGYVEWTASNENFSYSVSVYGTTCTITSSNSGDTTFTALIYDAEGNIISADTQTMTSKAGFFQKIIAFLKRIFGLTKVIPQ